MPVKVKICGITNYEDAKFCLDAGADMLGFNFYEKSSRYIEPGKAFEIINKLPGFVDIAGVFVNPDIDLIKEVAQDGLVNWVQLHGDEEPGFCDMIHWDNVRTMKAIRVKDEEDIKRMDDYHTDAILLDSYSDELYGGTGKRFDWELLDVLTRRIYLAGGIGPENAANAVRTGVYGIDVCSMVEAEPGKKDHEKVSKLFDAVRGVSPVRRR
jgi:phosphoribosylanthranilate isomerase